MKKRKGAQPGESWEKNFSNQLPLLGHRNWIAIADSAYPAHSSPGIETVMANGNPLNVIRKVITKVATCRHVHPNIYTDLEINFVNEKDVPAVTDYRRRLAAILKHTQPRALLHEQIIAKLDECTRMFRVLIIKTELTIPYTSVFLELDCGYWTPDAEQRLREAMRAEQTRGPKRSRASSLRQS